MSSDLEHPTGYTREDYADEFGSYFEAIQRIKPHAEPKRSKWASQPVGGDTNV